MCGGGNNDQTVTQRTEIDPALQRLLYGGALGAGHGIGGGGGGSAGGGRGGGGGVTGSVTDVGGYGGDGIGFGGRETIGSPMSAPGMSDRMGYSGGASFGGGGVGSGALYAAGGPVQSGIASMQGSMPMARGMPMMNGRLPNLSNPEIAATLAMAQQRPAMMQRRFATGGYVEGPGSGTSDSIPAEIYQGGQPVQKAALSDGEFVMTEKAVLGAGEGDRDRGAARMYEMMRLFERGGRV
jgi:hypothetical protein